MNKQRRSLVLFESDAKSAAVHQSLNQSQHSLPKLRVHRGRNESEEITFARQHSHKQQPNRFKAIERKRGNTIEIV